MGAFQPNAKPGESATFYYYLHKSDVRDVKDIAISISAANCYNGDLDLYRIRGTVRSSSLLIVKELNALIQCSIVVEFLTFDGFISYQRDEIHCYAIIVDTEGKLITWAILSSGPETGAIRTNQTFNITCETLYIPKEKINECYAIIFTRASDGE